jgi:phosphoenolpyruvate-protein phosphotransferase
MDAAGGAPVVLRGVAAAPGQALGPVLVYRPAAPVAPVLPIDPAQTSVEQARVAAALAGAQAELDRLAEEVAGALGPEEAAIFSAQALMATDPLLSDRAAELVAAEHYPADAAILAAADEQAALLAAIDDPYLRERAADVRDVGRRAARIARGEPAPADLRRLPGPVVILAEDLSPSETAGLDRAHVLGIGLSGGGPTSHAAVVARALGVPLVCGLGAFAAHDGQPALLDGDGGWLTLDPGPDAQAAHDAWRAARGRAAAADTGLRDLPAETRDGRRIRLAANAGSVADAQQAAGAGAAGIGLLRTEFLFLDHRPDEAEQEAAYRAIYAALPGCEVVVRTLDLGGDKPPPYLDFGREANPFLGWRGLRVALDEPDLLRTQLRALLRAGAGRAVHVMFPMVTTRDEWRRARALVDEVRAELAAAGTPAPAQLAVGIMVEVPAAALLAPVFAAEADFFSIGTNDLTQYTLAADRGAARVAHLYSPIHPAVLQLIARTVEASHAAGHWTGICGEAAGNPAWAPLWVGLGVDELSMAPAAIPAVKRAIRGMAAGAARTLAAQALAQATPADVEALLTAARAAET